MRLLLALSYADRRALVNGLRMLRRHPGRLAMWTLYALAIIAFAFVKTTPHRQNTGAAPPFLVVAVNDFWVCGLAFAFGIVLATGTSRWLGVFSSRAEALLLTRSDASPVLVAAYLQLRAVAVALAHGFTRFAYVIVFGIPSGSSIWALVAQLCFFAAAGAAIASIALPRALVRGRAGIALAVTGAAIAAAAAFPLLVDLLRLLRLPETAAVVQRLPVFHPGTILGLLAAGDLRTIALPLVLAALATAAFALAARDAYPDLYAISLANLDWRMRVRERRDGAAGTVLRIGVRAGSARSASGTRLRGAFALLWVDGLLFARSVSPAVTAIVATLALLGGIVFAWFARHDPELAFGILAGAGPGLAIAIASTTGVRLAPVLRMPLFWLGDVPLAARIGAWAAGVMWRDTVVVALVAAGFAGAARDLQAPLLAFVGASGLLMLTRAVGIAVFALLPSKADQRGPAVMVRALLSFALVAPPLVAGVVTGVVLGAPLAAGVLAGAAVALGEASLLVILAARRLAGRVDTLSLA